MWAGRGDGMSPRPQSCSGRSQVALRADLGTERRLGPRTAMSPGVAHECAPTGHQGGARQAGVCDLPRPRVGAAVGHTAGEGRWHIVSCVKQADAPTPTFRTRKRASRERAAANSDWALTRRGTGATLSHPSGPGTLPTSHGGSPAPRKPEPKVCAASTQ